LEGERSSRGNVVNDFDDASTTALPRRTTSTELPTEYLYKVLVVGGIGAGKTSLIRRTVDNLFSTTYKSTIGVDFALKTLTKSKPGQAPGTVFLQLWDIAGQERYSSLTRVYYRDAVGALLVCDAMQNLSESLECAKKWKEDMDSKVQLHDGSPIPVILCANKCDLLGNIHQLNEKMINEFVQKNGFVGWFATSAKTNLNIDESLDSLTSSIFKNAAKNCLLAKTQGPSLSERTKSLELSADQHRRDEYGGCC